MIGWCPIRGHLVWKIHQKVPARFPQHGLQTWQAWPAKMQPQEGQQSAGVPPWGSAAMQCTLSEQGQLDSPQQYQYLLSGLHTFIKHNVQQWHCR